MERPLALRSNPRHQVEEQRLRRRVQEGGVGVVAVLSGDIDEVADQGRIGRAVHAVRGQPRIGPPLQEDAAGPVLDGAEAHLRRARLRRTAVDVHAPGRQRAGVAEALGCAGIRVEKPEELAPALESGLERSDRPTVIDVLVTRDPAKMLPGVDSRTAVVEKGDRVA